MLGLLRVAEQRSTASSGSGSAAGSGSGSGSGSGRRARRIILFTDVVGSMALNAAAGDDTYYQLLRSHDHVLHEMLRAHDGVQFKHTGDGVAAWFNSASQGIDCAFAMVDHLVGLAHVPSGLPVAIRCGLSAGEPIESDGDLFGLAVGRAAAHLRARRQRRGPRRRGGPAPRRIGPPPVRATGRRGAQGSGRHAPSPAGRTGAERVTDFPGTSRTPRV